MLDNFERSIFRRTKSQIKTGRKLAKSINERSFALKLQRIRHAVFNVITLILSAVLVLTASSWNYKILRTGSYEPSSKAPLDYIFSIGSIIPLL